MNLPFIHNDDTVCILHTGYTLCNDKLGRVRDFLRECLADERIRLGIYRTGRVIKNEDLRLFQQRTRNAESQLLTAGNIRAALLKLGVELIRHLQDEYFRQ